MESDLEWLPERPDWQEALAAVRRAKLCSPAEVSHALREYRALANCRLDLALTAKLDRAVQRHLSCATEKGLRIADFTPVRLAVLGSSTLGHLIPSIRVGGLRRGLLIEVYEGPYGTWRQELADKHSGLHAFHPDMLLFALDANHIIELERTTGRGGALHTLRDAWQAARNSFGCAVIQQSAMPLFPPVLGHAEYLLSESPGAVLDQFNTGLRAAITEADGVHLLALDHLVFQQGLGRWHSRALWYRVRQEVHPAMAPLYGDHVARVLAALLGLAAKCLVLDLDHTLWGGGIGDEGLEGIVIGEGAALGEAHLELQRYARALRDRGIVLAVCSKNDMANALLPFEQHPQMLLRREDFACFIANWGDKAANVRRIARDLNLGLDALVFVDDNPAERGLIRRELPEVQVPELPGDPAEFAATLAAAGYFESVGITAEDRTRAALYANSAERSARLPRGEGDGGTSLEGYLASLNMRLEASRIHPRARPRIVQLINKTNQFNLTTQRVLDSEVERLAAQPGAITLQLRLEDIYGDHGIIAVAIAETACHHRLLTAARHTLHPIEFSGNSDTRRTVNMGDRRMPISPDDLLISHWLMSCRVLGRGVEDATFNLLADQAQLQGAQRLFGLYLPTAKNGMVRDLYARLGFQLVEQNAEGAALWSLDLARYRPISTQIAVHSEVLSLQPAP